MPRQDALWGILHDASEAYLCDLPTPIKRDPQMRVYRIAEDRLMAAVCAKFGLEPEMPYSVCIADKVLLATEFRDLTAMNDLEWIVDECGQEPLPDFHIAPWSPAVAEARFMGHFRELTA